MSMLLIFLIFIRDYPKHLGDKTWDGSTNATQQQLGCLRIYNIQFRNPNFLDTNNGWDYGSINNSSTKFYHKQGVVTDLLVMN